MMDPDLFFFRQMDAYYHFNQASLIKYCEKYNHLQISEGENEKDKLSTEFVFKKIEKVRSSSIRFIRYHQIETLLTVLLGSYPHGPIVFFSKNPKLKISEISKKIANCEIPKEFEVKTKNGKILEYDDWISFKITNNIGDSARKETKDVAEFIRTEALVFSDSRSYVSFKHGCMLSSEAPQLKLQDHAGKWINLFDMSDPIAWINCDVSKGKMTGLHVGAEDLAPDSDLGFIFISAMIVDAIKSTNISRIENKKKANIRIPNKITEKKQIPNRFSMKLQLADTKEGGKK